MTQYHPLSQRARLLKNANPEGYDKFIEDLRTHVTEVTVAVTEAAPSDILVAQGRAREARKFLQLMTELPE